MAVLTHGKTAAKERKVCAADAFRAQLRSVRTAVARRLLRSVFSAMRACRKVAPQSNDFDLIEVAGNHVDNTHGHNHLGLFCFLVAFVPRFVSVPDVGRLALPARRVT